MPDAIEPSESNASDAPSLRTRRCPKCVKRFTFQSIESWKPYPFCSERCRLIDLGSWLSEEYQIVEKAMDPEALAELDEEELERMLREQLPEDMRPGLIDEDGE